MIKGWVNENKVPNGKHGFNIYLQGVVKIPQTNDNPL